MTRGKKFTRPKDGDTRVICRFLFFPRTLPIDKAREVFQRRWWERARIEQICHWPYDADMFTSPWVADRWAD